MLSFECDYACGAHPKIMERLLSTNLETLPGYGIMSKQTDVTLADIARICDVFYIVGTKIGALFAKGRLLGVQFDTFF